MRNVWLWITGINEYYTARLFFKELCCIGLIYLVFAVVLLISYRLGL